MRTGVALLLVATSIAPAADPPKAKLAELVKLYRAYDLPLPPKTAKLYRFTDEQGEKPERRVWLQLVFRPEAEDGPNMTLRGLDTNRLSASNSKYYQEVSPPDAKALAGVTDDTDDLLLLAIQCDLLGLHDLAVSAFDTWQGRQLKHENPVTDLRYRAWNYWEKQIREPNSDWVKIARRLQGMHNDKPNATDVDAPGILRRLKLSLVPSKAKPGSVDALIDELIDVPVVQNFYTFAEPDPRFDAIVKLGFDAIPALIDHLDDDRLTRAHYHSSGLRPGLDPLNFLSYPYSVKHLVRDIICDYMADDTSQLREMGKDLSREKALAWWAGAKKEGEEKYLVRKVIPDETSSIRPKTQLIRVIELKYPHRLPDIFVELRKSEPHRMTLAPYVEALVRSPLPAATKKQVLLDALDSNLWSWKAEAIAGLQPLDAAEFHKQLIAHLADLPAEFHEKDFLHDWFDVSAQVVSRTDDVKVWEAVSKYMRRVGVDVRKKWIANMTDWGDEESRSRLRRIACVAAFLEDESVRDYAVEQLGRMLEVPVEPDPSWSADEWTEFRKRVATAAARELENKPAPKAKPAGKK